MIAKVSIVIPCYNSENTLEETLQSVFDQEYKHWEAIMVNDGSLDNLEAIALKWIKKDSRFKYFKKTNGGLATARNFGIEKAKGEYILPLDSDNKIRPEFLITAINIFETKLTIGVVYGDAFYFGDKDGLWEVGSFNHLKMLDENFIDACAVIKKSLFESTGGYDENLPHQGHEDWDFWLRVMKTTYNFYYLNEVTFDYRVSNGSMIKSFDVKMLKDNTGYIKQKHFDLYVEASKKLLKENSFLKKEIANSAKKRTINVLKRFFKL